MILALDTCLDTFSVAVTRGEECLAEMGGGRPKTHLTQLFPALQAVLAAAAVTLEELTAVAVTTGPGSFTGVRLGVLAARTLGQTRNLPLVAVDTLEALALHCPYQAEVTVAVDARKSQVIWARYRTGNARPETLTPAQLSSDWRAEGLVLGNALVRYPQPQARCLGAWAAQVRATHVGRLGHWLLAEGRATDWRGLLPEYLREGV